MQAYKRYYFIIGLLTYTIASGNVFQVNIHDHCGGFFSWFKGIIGFLDSFDKNQSHHYQAVRFNTTGGYFSDPDKSANWWENYFEQSPANDQALVTSIGLSPQTFASFCDYGYTVAFSRERAHEIINKYIKVKAHIQKKVDEYVIKNFNNLFILGIHYRGTDKTAEAASTSYQSMINEIYRVIQNIAEPYKIFVATDDQYFLNYITSRFNNIIYLDMHRSNDGAPLHYGHHSRIISPYLLGEQALMDCLLLSKCNMIIRMYSNLSSAASDFNPHIPVITLNKNYGGEIYRPTVIHES